MRYTNHSKEEKAEAIARVLHGEDKKQVAKDLNFAKRTLDHLLSTYYSGGSLEPKRRGAAMKFPMECENYIATWIIAMQRDGVPVDRSDVLMKAREICKNLEITPVCDSWFARFLGRHPDITFRQAQVISRARNNAQPDDLCNLYETMLTLVVGFNLKSSQVYNMDETGFHTRKLSKRVLVLRGSKSVHSKADSTSFHMSIVACASASGHVIPPTFILPGKRIDETIAGECMEDAGLTTSDSGFINASLFVEWLKHFDDSIPLIVRRPVVLVCDGYLSHFSHPDVMRTLDERRLYLVCLPANATHLVQPLDVAVFAPYKKELARLKRKFLLDSGVPTIPKHVAVRLSCQAWKSRMSGENARSGFATCGLFPPSLEAMQERFERFHDDSLLYSSVPERDASWHQ
ncbi:hypothetical protein AeNC1_005511 [Aphanomyces euteiches]|nr:hypothetical protein AeNC1_005511 [Aphanomyces euteiches]